MRTIKFRGKEIKTGEWKYGDLMQLNDGSIRIGVQSKTWTDDGYHNNDYEDIFNVNEETIGQFTGLLDKNGKEMYEGDIVKCNGSDWGYEVVFTNGAFKLKRPDGYFFTIERDDVFEVIGNIHNNPELIEKGE